jgi:hypothetical protein
MMMTSRLEHYESKYQSLVSELQGLGFISQGSVVLRKTSCNKPGCKCSGVPPRHHGPYYQWTRKVSGKTEGRQLTEAEASLYEEWIDNRRELQRILGEMEKTSAKAGEILLRQAKSAARK